MGEVENKAFERICQNPGIEAIRQEAMRLAGQWAGDRDKLWSIWHGSGGMRSQIAVALGSLGSDAERYNECYDVCCRKLFRILHSGTATT